MFSNIKFPLYVVRQYLALSWEGQFRVIQTKYNKYILDVSGVEGDYLERRLHILRLANKPYDLYPLVKRIETISQMVNSGKRVFINPEGTLIRWKPTKLYKVECFPIESAWLTSRGTGIVKAKGLSTKFKTREIGYSHVQVLRAGGQNILFDLCNEHRPTTRKKL